MLPNCQDLKNSKSNASLNKRVKFRDNRDLRLAKQVLNPNPEIEKQFTKIFTIKIREIPRLPGLKIEIRIIIIKI